MTVRRGFWLALLIPSSLLAQFRTSLTPATNQAFTDYQSKVESQLDWSPRFTAARPGEISIAPLNKDGSIEIQNGVIHDWGAATVAKATTVAKVLAVLQDYDNFKNIYKPEVADSKLMRRDGNHIHAYLRLVKKKGLTAILNSEYDVDYKPLSGERWAILSRSTKVNEIDGDHELADGQGHGFLWRMNAYWLLEPRPEGVYVECRVLSLTRDIPTGLGWIVKPIVSGLPRESLRLTLQNTLQALH